jgi:ABC-type proline/glycine betaine transport system substrate-binding protein
VASRLAPEAETVVVAAALAASLLGSDQLPRLLESVSRTFAQWSSGVAVANVARGCLLLGCLLF